MSASKQIIVMAIVIGLACHLECGQIPTAGMLTSPVATAEGLLPTNAAPQAIAPKPQPSLHVIAIGINQYKNKSLTLECAVADAQAVAEAFRTGGQQLYKKCDIRLLTTAAQTTKTNIIKELTAMQSIGSEDVFVLFVASHAIQDEDTWVMLTSDVDGTSMKELSKNAIDGTTLTKLVSEIPAARKLLLLDTNSAGDIGQKLLIAALNIRNKVFNCVFNCTVITATTQTQGALEGYKGHGLFSYVVAEGLNGKADTNHDGYVKTTELADYVDNEVLALAKQALGREQYPMTCISGQNFPIVRVK